MKNLCFYVLLPLVLGSCTTIQSDLSTFNSKLQEITAADVAAAIAAAKASHDVMAPHRAACYETLQRLVTNKPQPHIVSDFEALAEQLESQDCQLVVARLKQLLQQKAGEVIGTLPLPIIP